MGRASKNSASRASRAIRECPNESQACADPDRRNEQPANDDRAKCQQPKSSVHFSTNPFLAVDAVRNTGYHKNQYFCKLFNAHWLRAKVRFDLLAL